MLITARSFLIPGFLLLGFFLNGQENRLNKISKETNKSLSLTQQSKEKLKKLTKEIGHISSGRRKKAQEKVNTLSRPQLEYICKLLLQSNDPELYMTAQRIKKKHLKPIPSLLSKLVKPMTKLPHYVDRTNDTLQDIADMYGSKVEWIKEVNPGLKTNADLKKLTEIKVPVIEK